MKLWKVMSCLLICSASLMAYAEEDDNDDDDLFDFEFDVDPVVTLSGGVAFSSDMGTSEQISVNNSSLNYEDNSGSQTRGVWGVFLGGEFDVEDDWMMQLGVSYYQSSTYSSQGVLAQGMNANDTTNYDYYYNIVARQILLEGKLLTQWYEIVRPYVSLGIGTGINTAENFSVDYPESFQTAVYYDDHTTTSFTYNLGLGVDVDLTDYLRLGVGYRFTDFGEVQLGQGINAESEVIRSGEYFQQNTLNAQEILLQLTILK